MSVKDWLELIGFAIVIINYLISVGGKSYRTVRKAEELISQSDEQKETTSLMFRALFTILDGLKQVGANGPVTDMRQELLEFITKPKE